MHRSAMFDHSFSPMSRRVIFYLSIFVIIAIGFHVLSRDAPTDIAQSSSSRKSSESVGLEQKTSSEAEVDKSDFDLIFENETKNSNWNDFVDQLKERSSEKWIVDSLLESSMVSLLYDKQSGAWFRLEEFYRGSGQGNEFGSLMMADSVLVDISLDKAIELSQLEFDVEVVSENLGIYLVNVPGFEEVGAYEDLVDRLSRVIPRKSIEPNYIYAASSVIPNDEQYDPYQWAFAEVGKSVISAPQTWEIQREASNVKIAILDTGIDIDHPDLISNLWNNPGEIPGNGIDDDNNGFVDDLHGYSFVSNSADVDDVDGHGTHVAGIAAAQGDNGIGVSGVAWSADLVAVKVLNDQGLGTLEGVIKGIEYANTIGAKILNMSFGGSQRSTGIEKVIGQVQLAGGIAVVAAGNEFVSLDESPSYPAAYNNPNIFSVTASDRNGMIAGFANYSVDKVDLAAPGTEIYSTIPVEKGSYGFKSGTSMAAPMVSGALALIEARFPNANAQRKIELIMEGLDRDKTWVDLNRGAGSLNLYNSIQGIVTAPYYDSFRGAYELDAETTSVVLNNVASGREIGEPHHNGSDSNTTIWLRLVMREDRAVSVSANGIGFDVDIAVYTGTSVDGLSTVSSGDSGGSA